VTGKKRLTTYQTGKRKKKRLGDIRAKNFPKREPPMGGRGARGVWKKTTLTTGTLMAPTYREKRENNKTTGGGKESFQRRLASVRGRRVWWRVYKNSIPPRGSKKETGDWKREAGLGTDGGTLRLPMPGYDWN